MSEKLSLRISDWYKLGLPWLWISAGAISVSVLLVVGVVGYIGFEALRHFWVSPITTISVLDSSGTTSSYMGELVDTEVIPEEMLPIGNTFETPPNRYLFRVGNREVYGIDFKWFSELDIVSSTQLDDATVFERREWGHMYGHPIKILEAGTAVQEENLWQSLQSRIQRAEKLQEEVISIQKDEIGAINYQIERLRLKQRKYQIANAFTEQRVAEIESAKSTLNAEYEKLNQRLIDLNQELNRDYLVVALADGTERQIKVSNIVRAYQPNTLTLAEKWSLYFDRMGEFIWDDPREANTEGGVFPAIFGTVMMVLVMTVIVTPFGVLAAVYLHEYAKQGMVTRMVRIAVINLAGVPSIVFGVFGLGFFVYAMGGSIDQIFYPESLPAPTFGTPGIIWAALTLALLTVPVVIVSTEEGLSRIPKALREGSLSLGATKAETLWKIVLPITAPAITTGLILAIARAAGEVAPLMLVGVVKLAPSLPLDGNFPFMHMERKFMHLGFHIYDVGFQSPNVEAARPLVYATAFLLVIIIVLLNITAIAIRNHLREKYRALAG